MEEISVMEVEKTLDTKKRKIKKKNSQQKDKGKNPWEHQGDSGLDPQTSLG
jgi:hypothetical protein